jgi:hypothetical protein
MSSDSDTDYGFLTFIHEPSFYQLLDKGAAPRELTLMLAVCSLQSVGRCLAARFIAERRLTQLCEWNPGGPQPGEYRVL